MSCPGDHQPAGYIGVQFSELQTVMGDEMPLTAPLRDYPTIDSVYPGSPASKAGVRRGDVVLRDRRRGFPARGAARQAAEALGEAGGARAARRISAGTDDRRRETADGFPFGVRERDRVIGPEFDQPMVFMRARAASRRRPERSCAGAGAPAPTDAPSAPMFRRSRAISTGFRRRTPRSPARP